MSHIAPTEPGPVPVTASRSIADLLWVANTEHGAGAHWHARANPGDHDHDHLVESGPMIRYLVDHHVRTPTGDPTVGQVQALGAIRSMVRGLVDPAAGWTPDVEAIRDATTYRLTGDGRLAAGGDDWDAFIGDLLPALLALLERRERLSMCGNPLCKLLFLDESRNGTRRWCDGSGCGNRDRVKRHRRRPSGPAT